MRLVGVTGSSRLSSFGRFLSTSLALDRLLRTASLSCRKLSSAYFRSRISDLTDLRAES